MRKHLKLVIKALFMVADQLVFSSFSGDFQMGSGFEGHAWYLHFQRNEKLLEETYRNGDHVRKLPIY